MLDPFLIAWLGIGELATTRSDSVQPLSVLDADGEVRTLADIEAAVIQLAMTRYHRPGQVAYRLGIGRSTLYRKLKQQENADASGSLSGQDQVG